MGDLITVWGEKAYAHTGKKNDALPESCCVRRYGESVSRCRFKDLFKVVILCFQEGPTMLYISRMRDIRERLTIPSIELAAFQSWTISTIQMWCPSSSPATSLSASSSQLLRSPASLWLLPISTFLRKRKMIHSKVQM